MAANQFRIIINRPVETVFQLIADLPNYGRWLSESNLYQQTLDISDNPVRQGTTYIDHGTSTRMRGEIIEFKPPHQLGFLQQSSTMFGQVTIQIRYTLTAVENNTQLLRAYQLTLTGLLKLLQPMLVRTINRENERILQKMKQYLEAN